MLAKFSPSSSGTFIVTPYSVRPDDSRTQTLRLARYGASTLGCICLRSHRGRRRSRHILYRVSIAKKMAKMSAKKLETITSDAVKVKALNSKIKKDNAKAERRIIVSAPIIVFTDSFVPGRLGIQFLRCKENLCAALSYTHRMSLRVDCKNHAAGQ